MHSSLGAIQLALICRLGRVVYPRLNVQKFQKGDFTL
jgi:hypothetical protein